MKVAQKPCVMKNFNMKVNTVVLQLITQYPLPILNPIEIFDWSKIASRRPKMSFFTETKKS